MEQLVVVTAVGQDRPGIIAALTGAVYSTGGNLDDATMTRLHGAFAAMVAARLPETEAVAQLQQTLVPVAHRLGLSVTVQLLASGEPPQAAPDYLLTVYGADRPGIVHEVTARLAAYGVNITDMDTRLAGTPQEPLYVMLLEITAGETDLAADLAALRSELGVEITLQPLDAEAL